MFLQNDQEFGENTSDGPDVVFLTVVRAEEYDFGGSVPSRGNVASEFPLGADLVGIFLVSF